MRWSISPTSSPMTAAGRCMCSMPPRSKANLVVRRARPGETLLALDGKTYALDDTMCVIADDGGVESLAGIMGGEASGCSETTTDVLIESALWDETQHRPYRPQAEHQFRRPLPLRARGRSGLHDSRPRARDPHGARPLRRHRDGNHRGGRNAHRRAGDRFPPRRGQAPRRPRRSRPRRSSACSADSASSPRAPARSSG